MYGSSCMENISRIWFVTNYGIVHNKIGISIQEFLLPKEIIEPPCLVGRVAHAVRNKHCRLLSVHILNSYVIEDVEDKTVTKVNVNSYIKPSKGSKV